MKVHQVQGEPQVDYGWIELLVASCGPQDPELCISNCNQSESFVASCGPQDPELCDLNANSQSPADCKNSMLVMQMNKLYITSLFSMFYCCQLWRPSTCTDS